MVELKGSLREIGLPAIVQLIGELHHSGSLELKKGEAHGVLGFEQGRLVTAAVDEEHGLAAVEVCALQLADGEFRFIEEAAAGEHTLDFAPPDLQRLLDRIRNGNGRAHHVEIATNTTSQAVVITACPKLGYADDPTRHYSRATALHRCFAGRSPSLVSSHEQLELCLSGEYRNCPRYHAAIQAASVVYEGEDSPAAAAEVPPAIATRRSSNRALLIGGLLAGLIVLLLLLVVALPALLRPSAQTTTPAAGAITAPVSEPVATPNTRVAGVAVQAQPNSLPTLRPTLVPTSAPVVAAPRRIPTPSTVAAAPVATGASLLDLRFATGPADNWVENPPFTGWSDGAFRMQAVEATRFVAVGVPLDPPDDVVVSGTFRKTGGPPGGGYGLIVRDQGPLPRDGANQDLNAYVLEAGDLGEFGIWRRDGDHWVDLIPWTHSTAVRLGGSPNDLIVRAIGDRLMFTINGVQVASVQDGALSSGSVGLFVGGDFNEVAVDRLSVLLPQ